MSVSSANSYATSGLHFSTRVGAYAALAISIAAIVTSGWVYFTAAKAAAYYGVIIGATGLSLAVVFNAGKVAAGSATRSNRAVGALCLLAMTVAFAVSCLASWFHARDMFTIVLTGAALYFATFVAFSWDFTDSPED
jgi:hypothetical protein